MSDKILSREEFELQIQHLNMGVCSHNPIPYLMVHDAALRADRDQWKVRATKAMEVLAYYGSLGACACTKDCECGHCKARRVHAGLLENLPAARAEAQPDAVNGLVDALTDCIDVIEPIRDEMYKQGASENDPVRLDAGKCCDEVLAFARAALKQYEEAKAKGGE